MGEDESQATSSGLAMSEKGAAKCRECGARRWEVQPVGGGIAIVYCGWCDVALGCVKE